MNNKWWGNPDNAQEWIEQNKRRTKDNKGKNSTTLSTKIVLNEFKKNCDKNNMVLEVGSGDGRLIGPLSSEYKCSAFDVNETLLRYIDNTFKNVKTYWSEDGIIALPFDDNEFDIVFTYQVLQHIHPEDIKKALNELQRVCKKELWMWEGIGRIDYENGAQTHKAHDGSWVWHISKLIKCDSVTIPSYRNSKLVRQRLYKYKKI